MFAPKEFFGMVLRRLRGESTVYVRETNFGYVIRSERAADSNSKKARISQLILIAFSVAAIAVWFLPFSATSFWLALCLSSAFMVAGLKISSLIYDESNGIELHVDVGRSELRSAVVTPRGESWIRLSARFSEVVEVYLRRPQPQSNIRSLCMRIVGEQDPLPIAIGDERTLLQVHDRLTRDLSPRQEHRLAKDTLSNRPTRAPEASLGHVFPRLGPDEVGY